MAHQGQGNMQSAGQMGGHGQMARNEFSNQGYQNQSSQHPDFLQETGTQVKHMAQGAADIASGAAQGAVSMVRGAATGAANIASGAADAVKKTMGINPDDTSNYRNNPNNPSGGPNPYSNYGVNNPDSGGIGNPNLSHTGSGGIANPNLNHPGSFGIANPNIDYPSDLYINQCGGNTDNRPNNP